VKVSVVAADDIGDGVELGQAMITEYLKSGLLIKRSEQPEYFSLEEMPKSDEGSLDQQQSNQQIPFNRGAIITS